MKISIQLILVAVLLCGCSQPVITETVADTPTIELTAAASPSPTNTITLQPTNTIEPTIVLTRTPTFTTIPTLTPREAQDILIELLGNNGGCRLPCFLGVTPGENSSQDAVDVYHQFDPVSEWFGYNEMLGEWDLEITLGMRELLDISITFQALDNIVNSIEFTVFTNLKNPPQYPYAIENTDYRNLMMYYMLSSILAEYGPPDEIYLAPLAIEDYPYEYGSFYLLLLYAQQGFAVHYETGLQVRGDQVLGCMNYASVEFEFLTSGNPDAFYENLPSDWKTMMEKYHPIDFVPGMTIDSFYETFRNPTDQCIESPVDFWYGDDT